MLEAKAELIARTMTSTSIEDLPTEIIREIARQLRHTFIRNQGDDQSHSSHTACGTVDTANTRKHRGGDRCGCPEKPQEPRSTTYPLPDELPAEETGLLAFSTCNRRFREIVFGGCLSKFRMVRYCDWWNRRTREMSVGARGYYRLVFTGPLQLASKTYLTVEYRPVLRYG
jgi:hypothetical protein